MLKKAAISIIILGAAGVAGFWILNKTSHTQATSAALFLPQETLFFSELRDLPTTALRWKETSLARIAQEPEVKAFLERPLAKLEKETSLQSGLAQFRRIQARQGFFAVTSITEANMPQLVAGFSFSGPREEVAGLIKQAKAKAQAASPAGKSELTKYKEFEIESFSADDITIAGTFAGEWYLVANNLDLLKQTLDRLGDLSAKDRLAHSDIFKKCVAPLPSNPEIISFLRPQVLMEKIIALSAASGSPQPEAQVAEIRKIQGVAGSIRFDGPRIHETLYTYMPDAIMQPKLDGSSMVLTSPQTLFYYAAGLAFPKDYSLEQAVSAGNPAAAYLSDISGKLQEKGITFDDVKSTIGKEFAILMDWPTGAMMPGFSFSLAVTDNAKAKQIFDIICADWASEEKEGISYRSLPPLTVGIPVVLAPTAALTDKVLLLGLDRPIIETLATRAKNGNKETLATSPLYKEALATVPTPTGQVAFLDTKAFFERFYGTVRPMAQLSGSFIPGVADVVDLSKLPTTEAISKHLLPTIVSLNINNEGQLIESTGTLSIQGIALTSAGAFVGTAVSSGKLQELQKQHNEEEAAPAATPTAPAAPAATPEEAEETQAAAKGSIDRAESAPATE